jgi:hypothetical protein
MQPRCPDRNFDPQLLCSQGLLIWPVSEGLSFVSGRKLETAVELRAQMEQQNMRRISGPELQRLLERAINESKADSVQQTINGYGGNAEFCFAGIDWEKLRDMSDHRTLHLPLLQWGRNSLDFTGCDFGDGDITLSGKFDGSVRFEKVRFGQGNVSFANSVFRKFHFDGSFSGQGDVIFSGSRFHGTVRVSVSDLGHKNLNFGATTGEELPTYGPVLFYGDHLLLNIERSLGSTISFYQSQIHSEHVYLDLTGAQALERVSFGMTQWHSTSVYIRGLQLSQGKEPTLIVAKASFEPVSMLTFDGVGMTHGRFIFDYVRFPVDGLTRFAFSDVRGGNITFFQAHFANSVEFVHEAKCQFGAELSLRGATVDGPLRIDGIGFGPVPNLIATEFKKHLDLSRVDFGVDMSWSAKRSEKDRGAKLQRLKELAEGNRNHGLALRCHAEEMKFNRFRNGLASWPAGILDLMYEAASDYGQSIFRPCLWLLFTWIAFGLCYRESVDALEHPFLFSFSWLLPFLPATGVLRETGFQSVFSEADASLYVLAGVQGFISFSLLFLIGLGFRNRFRI